MFEKFIIVFLCTKPTHQQFDFNLYRNVHRTPERLLDLMQHTIEDCASRIREANWEKVEFDNHPFFEMGYVLGEMVEKYRKMVAQNKRCSLYKSITTFEVLKRTSLIQKLYFEVYHLGMMHHEVPRKHQEYYGPLFDLLYKQNFDELSAMDIRDIQVMLKKQRDDAERDFLERQKRTKVMQAIKNQYHKAMKVRDPHRDTTRWWWPLEYGWEINEYW